MMDTTEIDVDRATQVFQDMSYGLYWIEAILNRADIRGSVRRYACSDKLIAKLGYRNTIVKCLGAILPMDSVFNHVSYYKDHQTLINEFCIRNETKIICISRFEMSTLTQKIIYCYKIKSDALKLKLVL